MQHWLGLPAAPSFLPLPACTCLHCSGSLAVPCPPEPHAACASAPAAAAGGMQAAAGGMPAAAGGMPAAQPAMMDLAVCGTSYAATLWNSCVWIYWTGLMVHACMPATPGSARDAARGSCRLPAVQAQHWMAKEQQQLGAAAAAAAAGAYVRSSTPTGRVYQVRAAAWPPASKAVHCASLRCIPQLHSALLVPAGSTVSFGNWLRAALLATAGTSAEAGARR